MNMISLTLVIIKRNFVDFYNLRNYSTILSFSFLPELHNIKITLP